MDRSATGCDHLALPVRQYLSSCACGCVDRWENQCDAEGSKGLIFASSCSRLLRQLPHAQGSVLTRWEDTGAATTSWGVSDHRNIKQMGAHPDSPPALPPHPLTSPELFLAGRGTQGVAYRVSEAEENGKISDRTQLIRWANGGTLVHACFLEHRPDTLFLWLKPLIPLSLHHLLSWTRESQTSKDSIHRLSLLVDRS